MFKQTTTFFTVPDLPRKGFIMFFRQSPKQKKTLLHRTPTLECLEARLVPTGEFFLHSLPGATKRIFLDFDGHTTTNPYNNTTSVTPAYNIDGNSNAFSATELGNIREIWERVSEDFLPFNIDVTTQDPGVDALRKVGSSDSEWGIRVLFGVTASPTLGGFASLGSFTGASDSPAFVFSGEVSGNPEDVALIASHEAGHTLGLDHDGTSIEGYYGGHGQGTTSWGPLLGAPYGRNLTQWSKGEYADADNHEDDLAIITNATNGFGYRKDDHGSGISNASNLTISNSTNFNSTGIIEQNTDQDFFRFNLVNPGLVNISINPATNGPNLDIEAKLYNSNGVIIDTNNLFDSLSASISSRLPAGTYYISVDGAGQGDPLKSGYTDYGSLGFYSITGTVSNLPPNPSITGPSGGPSATHSTITVREGNTQVFNFTADKSVTWNLNGGSDKSRFIINPATGALSFISSPDFENPLDSDKNNSYVVVVQATDSSGLVSSQSVTVTIGDVFDTKPIDTNGARVLSAQAIGLEGNIITGFKVKFSEPILPDSFTNADLRVDGPQGKITPGQPTANSPDNTEFVFSIPKATGAGSYKLRVGVDIFDYSNNKMNNDGDAINGEFILDGFEKSFVLSSESTLQATNSSRQSIKDQGTITSQINISENFKIKDLNVKVNASHTQDSDLVITLKAPNGQVVTLVNRRGGSGDNFTNTWFDDEANTAITSGKAPFTGSFKPEGKLSSLDGINAKGTWTLTISDKVKGNTGSLIQWSLKLTGNQLSTNAMAVASSPLKMAPVSQPAMVPGVSSFASVIDRVASGILNQAKSEVAAMALSAENTFRGFQQDRTMNPGLRGSVQVKDQVFSQEAPFSLSTPDSVSDKVLANIITDKGLIWSAFRQN